MRGQPPYTWRSAAVVHARVLHAEDLGVLVLQERGIHDLAEEQRVVADLYRPSHIALEVRDRLREHGCAGYGAVEVREAVQRARREIDLHGLGELADDRPVFPIDEAQ